MPCSKGTQKVLSFASIYKRKSESVFAVTRRWQCGEHAATLIPFSSYEAGPYLWGVFSLELSEILLFPVCLWWN